MFLTGTWECIYATLGNQEKALKEYLEAMRLEPNSEINYLNLGGAYSNLNRLDEAQAVYKQAEEHKLESENLLASRYTLAFLKGDTAQMAHLASAAMGKPGTEDVLLAIASGHGGLVREVEQRTRAHAAGDVCGRA